MSPIQTNTQKGEIVVPAATDLSASIGCFAVINSSAQAALPASHGYAGYVIADVMITPVGTNNTTLLPLDGSRNVRVIAGSAVTAADKITTDAAGKAVTASSGNNFMALAEESGVTGQYVLLRPLGGFQTA